MSIPAHESLKLIRHKQRPTVRDYAPMIFDDFIEIHGDRMYGDDHAIRCGIARLNGMPVTVIGQDKGRNLEERKETNFAMPQPEGYRKALRVAKQAEKFHRPVILFVDTPGAFCGVGAEERGQGGAIAWNLFEFMNLKTPTVMVVLGEGGSGGALALGVCDRIAMLSNAIYSVISPKGFASIVWKDPTREAQAADLMKITPTHLQDMKIIDTIIAEPAGGAHKNPKETAANIQSFLIASLNDLQKLPTEELLQRRYEKFRSIGIFTEK